MKVASNIDSEGKCMHPIKVSECEKKTNERDIGVGCITNVHCEGNGRECRI